MNLLPRLSKVVSLMGRVPRIPARGGFALVVTLALLVLLTLLAVGLLSLSAISLRSANAGFAMQEARANARLGLVIALAELQRSLGPDRRVSAPAGVLDEVPESAAIDGVQHPNWTAVWSTEWTDTKTPWQRDDLAGGLRDRRTQPKWLARDHVENYLVSGNEGGRERGGLSGPWLDARSADLGAEAVRMVAEGSVADPAQQVFVKRVRVRTPTADSPRTAGSYAYWIGDLGVKANMGWADPHFDKTLGRGAAGLERLVHAQDVEEELMDGFGTIQQSETDRLVSTPTLNLARKVTDGGVKRHFHDLTTYSRSVLANVRDGGLQRDLTAYLLSTGTIPPLTNGTGLGAQGITDSDRMAGPANTQAARLEGLTWTAQRYREIAPCFGLVRRWTEQAGRTAFTQPSADMVPPTSLRDAALLNSMHDNVNVYDKANLNPASFLPVEQPNLCPVMVEGAIYYNLATFSDGAGSWVLRFCMYPRIALWNPYNIEMKLPQTVAELFVNGNKQVRLKRTDQSTRDEGIPFGRGSVAGNRHPAHYRGTVLWTLPAVTLAPGETQVFSAARSARYELDAIGNNLLSSTTSPSPTRYYYQDLERKHSQAPETFYEYPLPGFGSGSDNYLMALKSGGSNASLTDIAFDSLPLIVYANTSLQAGGGDELPLLWRANSDVPVYRLASSTAILPGTAFPDVRTRDGFRLRWWEEPPSNVLSSGQLTRHPRHLQSAVIANWNPRAAYFCRTPWENVSDVPPYFYGAYTRDSFDDAVSWNGLAPRSSNGKMRGFPFGPPQEGPDTLVLFEVPRQEVGIPSLGYLRHLKMSEFGWHPSYAIGNSLADPRVQRTGTSPSLASGDRQYGGWNQSAYGWASGQGNTEYWAMLTRQILFEKPTENNMVYDLSYELNHTLWDNYFLSTGSKAQKKEFFETPRTKPLPNGRIGWFSRDGTAETDINHFHRAASYLSLEGGFNVHSVSKDAWKALLTSTRDTGFGSESATPFPRVLDPKGGEWTGGNVGDSAIGNGFRSLTDYEIDRLAEKLVIEVKRRAPFFGLGDFVNRRLRDDETGKKGPVQAAIDAAALNAALDQEYPLDNRTALPNVSFLSITDSTRLDQTLLPSSTAWGIPGYLTQGDVMQVVGSSLRARSDSFVIRAYGESLDASGTVRASAWCEAIVQRFPDPIRPDATGLNPEVKPGEIDYGRKFRLVSFRWLAAGEV